MKKSDEYYYYAWCQSEHTEPLAMRSMHGGQRQRARRGVCPDELFVLAKRISTIGVKLHFGQKSAVQHSSQIGQAILPHVQEYRTPDEHHGSRINSCRSDEEFRDQGGRKSRRLKWQRLCKKLNNCIWRITPSPLRDTVFGTRIRLKTQTRNTGAEEEPSKDRECLSRMRLHRSGQIEGEATRGAMLPLKPDGLCDSVSGLMVVDPKCYLSNLKSMKMISHAETMDIKILIFLFKSVDQVSPKNPSGWNGTTMLARAEEAKTVIVWGLNAIPYLVKMWIQRICLCALMGAGKTNWPAKDRGDWTIPLWALWKEGAEVQWTTVWGVACMA
eukprot:Gb_31064 [translate_table: standard]